MEGQKCVLCGGKRFRTVKRMTSHVILRCMGCGLAFRDPKPTLEEAKAFYREHYFASASELTHGYEDYAALAAPTRKLARRKLAYMARRLEPGRLLDVGAAYGLFLDEALRAGWSAEGVEISRHAAAVARNLTGAPVHDGPLEETTLQGGSFDAVTLWDVLEHAVAIKPFCDRVRELLRPGGYVFVTVPNAASSLARLMGSTWFGYAKIEHVYYFSPGTLRLAFAQSGLDFLGWMPWPWACTVDYVARRMAIYSRRLAALARAAARFFDLSQEEVYFHWIDLLAVARKPPEA